LGPASKLSPDALTCCYFSLIFFFAIFFLLDVYQKGVQKYIYIERPPTNLQLKSFKISHLDKNVLSLTFRRVLLSCSQKHLHKSAATATQSILEDGDGSLAPSSSLLAINRCAFLSLGGRCVCIDGVRCAAVSEGFLETVDTADISNNSLHLAIPKSGH